MSPAEIRAMNQGRVVGEMEVELRKTCVGHMFLSVRVTGVGITYITVEIDSANQR